MIENEALSTGHVRSYFIYSFETNREERARLFDEWLAAHDAEVRAGVFEQWDIDRAGRVVAEEPEWTREERDRRPIGPEERKVTPRVPVKQEGESDGR